MYESLFVLSCYIEKHCLEPHFMFSPSHPYQCAFHSLAIVVRGVFLFREETQGGLPLGAFPRGRCPPIASVDAQGGDCTCFGLDLITQIRSRVLEDTCHRSDVDTDWEIQPRCLSETLGSVSWEPDGINKPGP